MTPDEVRRFLAAFKPGSAIRFVAEICYATGLRPSDACALRRNQIDLAAGELTVIPRKTRRKVGKELVLSIPDRLASMLREWMAGQVLRDRDGHLFLRRNGQVLSTKSISCSCARACRKAGITPIRNGLGHLRNAVIAHLLEAGVPPQDVANQVGHQDLRLIMQYARKYQPPREKLRRTAGILDDLRRG